MTDPAVRFSGAWVWVNGVRFDGWFWQYRQDVFWRFLDTLREGLREGRYVSDIIADTRVPIRTLLRLRHALGEKPKHGGSRMSPEQRARHEAVANAIVVSPDESMASIGKRFGISPQHASYIRKKIRAE